jgi:hypothetical protein
VGNQAVEAIADETGCPALTIIKLFVEHVTVTTLPLAASTLLVAA